MKKIFVLLFLVFFSSLAYANTEEDIKWVKYFIKDALTIEKNQNFELNENPKVIQALLGHKSVKTTITTYNSVDKSYFQKATDVINKNFKVEESKISPKDMEDDELDDELERLLKEKQARRKRNRDFEM